MCCIYPWLDSVPCKTYKTPAGKGRTQIRCVCKCCTIVYWAKLKANPGESWSIERVTPITKVIQSRSKIMPNLMLIIQPLPFKPSMLWINRQRPAVAFLQTGAAESVLVNIITYTNYCLGETNSWAWTLNVTLLKVTRFKGLRLSNTDTVQHWNVEFMVTPIKNIMIRAMFFFCLFFFLKKGKGRTNNKLLNLFLPILCKKWPSWMLFLFPVSSKVWKHFLIDGKPLKSLAPCCCLTCC